MVRFSTRSGTPAHRGRHAGQPARRRSAARSTTARRPRAPRPGPRSSVVRGSLAPAALPRPIDLGDLAHRLLAVAEDEGVDEVGQRLGVEGAVAAGHHQGVRRRRARAAAHRHPGQVDQVEDVGVGELGRQVEGQHVERRRAARLRLQREQRHRRRPAWPPPCPSTGRRRARPRRRPARSGSRRGSGGPGWAARSRRCRGTAAATPPARARARARSAPSSPPM